MVKGTRGHLCGRIVVVTLEENASLRVLLDTYIKYPPGTIVDYLTPWSKIKPWMMASGTPIQIVVPKLVALITGKTLVTQNGTSDFASLGLSLSFIRSICKHIELQTFFKRPDGRAYGLGPLVEYFGYRVNDSPVIIDHDCVQDALYTLKLHRDHYEHYGVFEPKCFIPSVKVYRRIHGL